MKNTEMSMLERSCCLQLTIANVFELCNKYTWCSFLYFNRSSALWNRSFVAKKLKSFSNDESISRSIIIMNSSNHQFVTVQLYRRILFELHVQI